jgi:hypothetical protein
MKILGNEGGVCCLRRGRSDVGGTRGKEEMRERLKGLWIKSDNEGGLEIVCSNLDRYSRFQDVRELFET